MVTTRTAETAPDETPSRTASASRTLLVLLSVVGLLVVPLIGAVGLGWVANSGTFSSARNIPRWVTVSAIQATTIDGAGVRAKVAFEVADSKTRDMVEREMRQFTLLLELSIASHQREHISGAAGMQLLAGNMKGRLNERLAASGGEEGVKSVAIQELLITKP